MSASRITIEIRLKDGAIIKSENALDEIGYGDDPKAIALMADD